MKEQLYETKGKLLVEANPRDERWGIGHSETDQEAQNENTWRGKNWLGYILTEVNYK